MKRYLLGADSLPAGSICGKSSVVFQYIVNTLCSMSTLPSVHFSPHSSLYSWQNFASAHEPHRLGSVLFNDLLEFDKPQLQLWNVGARCFEREVALHSLANLQSPIVVHGSDKPINCNNKHVQTVFLIICPQEVVVRLGNTFTRALRAETFEYSVKVHRGFKDHMRTLGLWAGSQPQLVTWPQLTAWS